MFQNKWSGFCNTDRVMCGPVCGVGLGWGGVEWVLQHRLLCAVLSVGLGWGGVEWVLQHRPCYVQSCLWGWDGVGWGGVCNNDCYKPLCLWGWGGVGFATQTVLCPGPIRLAISRCCQCTMT